MELSSQIIINIGVGGIAFDVVSLEQRLDALLNVGRLIPMAH